MKNSKHILGWVIVSTLSLGVAGVAIRSAATRPALVGARAKASAAPARIDSSARDLIAARAQLAEVRRNARAAGADSATDSTVTVTGIGRVLSDPDMMVTTLGVSEHRDSVGAAMEAANASMNDLVRSLKRDGVAARDIRTVGVSVQQTFRNDQPSGYEATNDVSANIRAIGTAGRIIGHAMNAAGDGARINGVTFQRDRNAPELARARESAMADAHTKAEDYARFAARHLGRVLSVAENSSDAPPPGSPGLSAPMAARDLAVPIEPGTTETGVRIWVVYELI